MAADRHGSHGLGQGAGTSHLDDMIHAGTSGPLPHPLTPIRMMTIVDGMIGAEGAGSPQFVVGGRCRDDGGAHGFGNLQRKDGNAAGAEDEQVSPAFSAPLTMRARQAVTPAVVSVAASANEYPFGARVNAVADATTTKAVSPREQSQP